MNPRIPIFIAGAILFGCERTPTAAPVDAAAAPAQPVAQAPENQPPATAEPEPEPTTDTSVQEPERKAPACEAKVAEVPTALFGDKVLIRPPIGVELVEDNPTVAMTYSTFVSTCDATIDRMQLYVFTNDEAKSLSSYLTEFLQSLEKGGYADGSVTPVSDSDAEVMSAVQYPAAGGQPPAKLLVAVERKLDNVFIVVFQTQPDQWDGLSETFIASARSLLVVPD